MRLIDKDALLEAIGEEYDDSDVEFMKGVYSQWKCDTDIIKSFHEIDQGSEIVRCKDCKYAVLTYQGELKYCKYFVDEYGFTNGGDPLYLEGDFFCAAGERR